VVVVKACLDKTS